MTRPFSSRRILPATLLLLLTGAMLGRAQTFEGSFAGTVTDPSGALVAGARVTILEQDKGFTRTTLTASDGTYLFPQLPPGRYRVSVEQEGFEKAVRGPINLTVNQHPRLDFTLKLGSQTATVTVEAEPLAVEADTSSVGTTLDQQKVAEVPLNGRSFLELALLVPGVSPGTAGTRISNRGGAINVNGMRDSMNSYWLDGLDDTSVGVGQFTVAPPIDSIQEFRMETGVYEAKFGAHAGAEVNVVTKSGTNEFHGTAYDYVRNTAFDARNFFDPSVPPFHRNQFGGTVGGPVIVPHAYDGHDHTFFFLAYEGTREHRGFYDNFLVPTTAERSGDFSDLLNPNCSSQNLLLNPFALAQGQIQPFTNINQVLPQADPVGQALVNQLYPAPNIAGASCGAANYTALVDREVSDDTATGRVDHRFSDKDSLFVRYNLNLEREALPTGTVPESTTTLPGYGTLAHNSYQMAGLDWTHIFGPRLVNEFKLGYNRWQLRETNQDAGNPLVQNLMIQGLNRANPQQTGVPDLNFSGYASIGADEGVPQNGAVNTFQIGDTFTQVRSAHTFSYGVDMREVHRGNFSVDNIIRGEFDFTGLVTGGLGQANSQLEQAIGCVPPACTLGNSVADALLGLPEFWINGFQEYISGAFGEYDAFASDDWRIRRNFTLNLGLRYEYKSLVTDKSNQFSNFDFSNGEVMVAGTSSATLESFVPNPNTGTLELQPTGTLNLGSTTRNRSLQYPDWHDFAPRIGFAWQPFSSSRTVVRGGYGIFYDQTFGDVYFQKANNPPFVAINTGNLSGALPLLESGTLLPGSGQVIQNALTGIVATAYPTLSPFQLNFRNAMIQEWTLDLQRQFRQSWLFDIGYVGTRGLHLVQETDPNQGQNLNSFPNESLAQQPAVLAACESQLGCPRPYMQDPTGFSYTQSSGSSIYHALQAKVERRFAQGLSVLASYTYSKSIDTTSGPFSDSRNANFPQNSYDVAAEKAVSDFNFPQRVSVAYLWAMPFGATVGKLDNPHANYVVEGWQVSSTFTIESGPPFTPFVSGNVSGADEVQITGTNNDTDRPNLTGQGFYPSQQTPHAWLNPSAFSTPSPFTFGDAGRNILRGPGLGTCDFALMRNFRVGESKNLEFRAEMFNIFNRANFDIPQRDESTASFGQVFNTVQPLAGLASGGPGEPRELQLALRLRW